jgi:hypothetical protein
MDHKAFSEKPSPYEKCRPLSERTEYCDDEGEWQIVGFRLGSDEWKYTRGVRLK